MRIKLIISITILFFFNASFAAIILEKAPIHTKDKTSIQRGAKFFATNCMVCHSVKYLKHDSLATAAGIDYTKMPVQAQTWTERPPPDLSLVAQARGANWLYTYLHSFYQDPSRTSNNNNLLIDNTAMPNPFLGIQGTQKLIVDKKILAQENLRWFNALELTHQGSMTAEEFDNTTADLVNFLVYASEPHKTFREHLGKWVLGFLIIFAAVLYLLKKEYWKDVRRGKK